MAERVGDALANRRATLIVEAGTGTGKTFAYLVPALLSGARVLISTGTRALQDQLFAKDLPLVARALGRPARVSRYSRAARTICVITDFRRRKRSWNWTAESQARTGCLSASNDWSQMTRSGRSGRGARAFRFASDLAHGDFDARQLLRRPLRGICALPRRGCAPRGAGSRHRHRQPSSCCSRISS